MADGRTLVPGTAEGRALVLDEPLSFWGGVDPETGDITDVRHPQHGASVTGRILVMPSGRGSSSSSSVLAESIRAGTAPAAIVLGEADPILALGSDRGARALRQGHTRGGGDGPEPANRQGDEGRRDAETARIES